VQRSTNVEFSGGDRAARLSRRHHRQQITR
jgi:hypothetical protein